MKAKQTTTRTTPTGTAKRAPIPAAVREQLRRDVATPETVQAAARRNHDAELSAWEARRECDRAKAHFELGCWLHYYAPRVYMPEHRQDRIDCVARLLKAGISSPGYDFYTVFRFGERHIDTCFEMGDADEVVAGLYALAATDRVLAEALQNAGISPRDAA